MQPPTQQVWARAQDSAFLTRSQVSQMLLVQDNTQSTEVLGDKSMADGLAKVNVDSNQICSYH